MPFAISGLHHVTAISANPRHNLDFYTRVLGLRLIKRTVNFDEQGTYHLYYGDVTGRPGTILTFFVRLDEQRGRIGNRQVTCVRFSVSAGSLDYWMQRIALSGVAVGDGPSGCDSPALSFRDPDGLSIELVSAPVTPEDDDSDATQRSPYAIRSLHSVELSVSSLAPTCAFLTDVLGFQEVRTQNPGRRRLATVGPRPGLFVDVKTDEELREGSIGAGSVHHVAVRVRDANQQRLWQDRLRQAGIDVTEVKDRKYFQSIYFCEPGGIRFEIATNTPGFTVDELRHELGRRLQLPASLEPARGTLEARLRTLLTSSP